MTDPLQPAPAGGELPDRRRGGRRRSTLLAWAATAALGAAVAAVLVHGARRSPPPPAPAPKVLTNVEVATVRAAPYREALVLPAMLEADRVASVSAEFAGRLERWLVSEGRAVAQGEVVAELDTTALAANLRELSAREAGMRRNVGLSRASLERARVGLETAAQEKAAQELALRSAEADLELARLEFERTRHLVGIGIVDRATLDRASNAHKQAEIRVGVAAQGVERAEVGQRAAQAGIEEAKAALTVAEAGVEQLEAAMGGLRVQLEKSRLRSPISGRLEEHLAEPGEVVSAGAALARIYDVGHLKAVVHAPDRFVPFLDAGNAAAREYVRRSRPGAVRELRAWVIVPGLPKLAGGEEPGLELPAEISRVAQASSTDSNSFAVELRVANPALALRHGVLARGRIEYLTHSAAIVIPVGAVQATDAGPRVLVVESREGRHFASVREVEPATIRDDDLLVLSGLRAGDELIVAGWKGVVTGEEVNVVVRNGLAVSPPAPR